VPSDGFLALVRLTFYRTLGSDPSWAMKLRGSCAVMSAREQASPLRSACHCTEGHQSAHASSIRRTCRDYKPKKA
jgi:hypothetical protein